MDNQKDINEILKNLFGVDLRNSPIFRVSWSDSQTEIRKRTYNKFFGHIFLKEVTETSECKKYPTIKSKWLIEQLIPPDSSFTNEIVSARENGSYECIYVFQDKDGKYLPLNLIVAKLVIRALLEPGRIGQLTGDGEYEANKEDAKEESRISEGVKELYEELMHTNKKYADGEAANKSGDYFINDATQKPSSILRP